MKILSKYKDYYDYLVGIYGIDEKLVLDRTKFDVPQYSDVVTFYICGKVIDGYYDAKEERFYFGNDIFKKFPKENKKHNKWHFKFIGNDIDDSNEVVRIPVDGSRFSLYANLSILDDKKFINEKMGCPIICSNKLYFDKDSTYYFFPKLDETGIIKVLPPHEIYILLSEWLGREKVINDNRTNDEKIVSAGFDKKISFRNIK
jgi:hypothetical protein